MLIITFFSAVFAFIFFGSQVTLGTDSVPEFSLGDISAIILVKSPLDTGSYIGSVISLNVDIQFSAFELSQDSHVIPYQKIICIYSLDNGEWKNASFKSVEIIGDFKNPFREGYWYTIHCTYDTVVRGIPEGTHNIRVTLKPDEIHVQDSNQAFRNYSSVDFEVKSAVGITILSPQNQTYNTYSLPLNFTLNRAAAWVGYSLDGQENVTTMGNTTLAGVTYGLHTLTIYANDTEGNTDTSEAIIFNVVPSPTPSPSSIVSVSPSAVPSTTEQPKTSPEPQPAFSQIELVTTIIAVAVATVAVVVVLLVFRRRK